MTNALTLQYTGCYGGMGGFGKAFFGICGSYESLFGIWKAGKIILTELYWYNLQITEGMFDYPPNCVPLFRLLYNERLIV